MRTGRLKRRDFITLLAGAAAARPLTVHAQEGSKVYRVGVLWPGAPSANSTRMEAFRQGLRKLGYVEGRNLIVVARGSEPGSLPTQLLALVDELAPAKIDVILTAGTSPTRAAQSVAGAIPVVMTFVGDPIGSGFVASLARPGGHITGLTNFGPEMSGKWLELIKELSPKASRVGILHDSPVRNLIGEIGREAETVAVEPHPLEVNSADELESAMTELLRTHVEALIVTLPPRDAAHRKRVLDFAAANRLPAVYWWREYVAAGGLVYYGPNINDMYGRAAVFVDKILKGAKPADLPVEQPTRFDLVINTRTAKALALDISPMLLARADEVIE
jgi:putative tryptophan/tyrosine transport system substrate-binding protein